jgi:hypothetical protein
MVDVTTKIQASESSEIYSMEPSVSKGRLWAGWILTVLATLFLLFDGVGKLFMPVFVKEAFVRLAIPESAGVGIGILLVTCSVVYAIPRTSVLGAILLTGYLGGAVAIHMRSGSPLFELFFPVIFGLLVWAGIFLREGRLSRVLPVRRKR